MSIGFNLILPERHKIAYFQKISFHTKIRINPNKRKLIFFTRGGFNVYFRHLVAILSYDVKGCASLTICPAPVARQGDNMRKNYVEICGVDTSKLTVMNEEKKRELLRKSKDGDHLAREELILGNLKLVLSVVSKFTPKNESASDLFQVGCIGLIKAIDNFNLDIDVRFSTYAVPMIIGEIRRHQRDNNAVRISRSMRDLAYRALGVKENISANFGRDASTKEIAEALGVSENEVGEALDAIVEPASLYDSVFSDGGEDSMYVIDKLSADGSSDDGWIENISLSEALRKLNKREMGIISRRFFKGKTQMEIADEIGISQAQVSRLEKGAIEKLRRYMA